MYNSLGTEESGTETTCIANMFSSHQAFSLPQLKNTAGHQIHNIMMNHPISVKIDHMTVLHVVYIIILQ